MEKITVGTTNQAKITQISSVLSPLGIEVVGVVDKQLLPEVVEDGLTARENARKKATVYAKALGERVLSMDNALYLDGLSPEHQPGTHVRRVDGRNLSDSELLDYYCEVTRSLGGTTGGYWEYGICIADPTGKFWEVSIQTPRVFTEVRSVNVIPGYPLESIQIDPQSGKYISDMSKDEQSEFWRKTIGVELMNFVQSIS